MTPIPPFSYAQIESICQELHSKLIDYQISACLSVDSKRFILILEKQADVQALLFCFESPLARFHLIPFSSQSRLPHHPLHAYLKDMKIKKLGTVNDDRIVRIELASDSKTCFLIGEFFSKHPNCYLTDAAGVILFSLYPSKQPLYRFPPQGKPSPASTSPLLTATEIIALYQTLEEEWKFQQEKQALEKFLNHELKKAAHKKKQLEQALEACQHWEVIQHEGDLIKAHLGQFKKGTNKIEVWDWLANQSKVIEIDPKRSIQEEMAKRYKQAKKLQKGAPPLQHQIERVEEKLSFLSVQQEKLQRAHLLESLIVIKNLLGPVQKSVRKQKKSPLTALPYYEYHSAVGTLIWVGKNAKANDRLTFQLTSGNDWWLHVHGLPGSHVVIKASKGAEPDAETLQDAIQLALLYSKAEAQGEGEVCVTQKKYVSRFGEGKTGKVQISKHKLIYARLNREYCKKIKERKRLGS